MNPFVLSILCFGFSAIFFGFMIFLKRRDEIGKWWFAFSALCGCWATGYSFQMNNALAFEAALTASRIGDAAAIFIPIVWLRFIYEFLEKKPEYKLFYPLYGLGAGLLLTAPTPLFIKTLKDKSNIGFEHFVAAGPAFHVFTVLFVAAVVYGFYLLLKAFFLSVNAGEKRNQIRSLMIAAAFGFGGGGTAFLPVYDIDFPIAYGTLLMPLFPFLMAFAITRYRLLDVDEMAKAAHREKLAAIGTLATSINHEIRNPLYIIQGLAQAYLANLREGIYSDKEKALEKSVEVLTKAEAQAVRAVDIMKRFSSFAKQQVQEQPAIEEVNLPEVLQTVLPLVQHELELEKIEIKTKVPESLPNIQADRRHVEQIFFNLVINACQAMKEKEMAGNIEINAEQQNGHVNILVKDTGPGIHSEKLKQVFEPFYTTKEQGTGLGLYITKQLVERNGGKISVKSRPNAGTKFTLAFPAK